MLSVETEGKLWSLGQAVAKPARLEPVMVTFVTAAEAPAAPAIVATHPRPGSGVAVDKPGRRDGNEQTLSRRRRSGVRDVADHVDDHVDDQLHGSGIEEMDSAIGVERHDGPRCIDKALPSGKDAGVARTVEHRLPSAIFERGGCGEGPVSARRPSAVVV